MSDLELHSISDLSRMTGLSTRTLRHYHQIGLLVPAATSASGVRQYSRDQLITLQRILALRQLGMPLPNIRTSLEDADDAAALQAHRRQLEHEQQRLTRQIAALDKTLDHLRTGAPLMSEEILDGFDHTQYREEVEERWGKEAYARSDDWWRGLSRDDQQAFQQAHADIAARWAELREAGSPADGEDAMANAEQHTRWISVGWGGKAPSADQLCGLADMYVADERFAANYGGTGGATYVRDALVHYAATRLLED